MRKTLLAVAVAAAFMVIAPGTAGATTFDGECQIKATVHLSPSINAIPQWITWKVTNGGEADEWSLEGQSGVSPWDDSTCTGTLDGKPYSGRVAMAASGSGLQSCDQGDLDGTGSITFLDAKKAKAKSAKKGKKGKRVRKASRPPSIDFYFSTLYAFRFPVFEITGTKSGKAVGTTQFWTTKHPGGFTNCVAEGKFTPDTFATKPANGVSDAMFQAYIKGAPGGLSD